MPYQINQLLKLFVFAAVASPNRGQHFCVLTWFIITHLPRFG